MKWIFLCLALLLFAAPRAHAAEQAASVTMDGIRIHYLDMAPSGAPQAAAVPQGVPQAAVAAQAVPQAAAAAQGEQATGQAQASASSTPQTPVALKTPPVLVFIHGWSCDGTFWKEQLPAFPDARRIVIDLPGFGKSDKPRNKVYSMKFFARAVKAVLDAAKVTEPVLIGHSMGYAVARQYLMDYPGTVRAVVNVDGAYYIAPTTPQNQARWDEEMEEFMQQFTGPKRDVAVREFVESTFYGQTPEALRPGIMDVMTRADANAANSALREMGAPEQWKHTVFSVPALAVYAASPFLPKEHEAYMRTVFPNLTYEEWPQTGHYLMLEQPQRFNALLRTFLMGLESLKLDSALLNNIPSFQLPKYIVDITPIPVDISCSLRAYPRPAAAYRLAKK